MAALEQHRGFADIDKSLKLGLPQLRVVPNRQKAAALGVDYSEQLYSGNRPVPVTDMGVPIEELFTVS